jgi:parvulin-like peptidyl-prolyl isomerase
MNPRLHILFLLALLAAPIEAMAQSDHAPMGVLAKAGETYITEKEFQERFELLPGLQRHRAERLEEAKLELLYSLIAEKLMAQEGRARRLDQDSLFRLTFGEVRKMLARDQLYREEVSGKVSVSAAELREGMAQALKEVLVAFIYCDRGDNAAFLRSQMKSPGDFERLEIDTSYHAVRDTATIIWGDAIPAIQRAAYSLKSGQLSSVIPAGDGFYILRVMRTQKNKFYASMQASVLRERVGNRIREQKEEQRLNEAVPSLLKNTIGFSKPEPLRRLASALKRAFSGVKVTGKTGLSVEMIQSVRQDCRAILDDTLAVAGDVAWSVGDIAERLFSKGFDVDSVSVNSISRKLNGLLRVWVQQELLAQEALKRGMDKYPAVRQQLETWYDNFLEQSMRFYLKKQVKVSEAEVLAFMQSSDSSVRIPRVRIRELKTVSLDEMHLALNEIQAGRSFEEVIKRWCSDEAIRARGGISDLFPISDRYPVGEIASQMLVGQRYGPIKDSTGYLYFELLSRTSSNEPLDSAYSVRKAESAKELMRMKEKRLVNLFLAQSGQSRGFTIFQDRLSKIQVSPIPMMTFRVLGFGGRMFAVPFVDRQIEWLNVEPPKGAIAF